MERYKKLHFELDSFSSFYIMYYGHPVELADIYISTFANKDLTGGKIVKQGKKS